MNVTRRALGALVAALALGLGCAPAGWAATAAPDQAGQWGDVLQWPLQAKHMILLQTGKVLVWASQANADPHLWDPAADPTGAHMVAVPFPAGDLHCAAQVTLADGRVLVVGGQNVNTHIGIPVTAIFDPVTATWTRGRDMHFARWYPTLTVMADGRVLVSSGDQPDGTGGYTRVTTPEIYDPSTDTWTDAAQPVTQQYLYPFMYQLPGGSVFEAGTRYQTQFYTPSAGGPGAWVAGRSAPFNTDSYSESGAMYAPGRIMRAGGGDPAQAHTAVIDTNVADPTKAQWRLTAPMNHPRRRMNAPLLLDGTILAIGGTAVGNNPNYAVKTSEIWDPATELWTDVAPITDPRMYHSTALSLPDGRVVSAGGQVTLDGATEDDPTSTSLQTTAQIYQPPFLFKGTRPVIASAPAQSAYGATLPITLGAPATTIAKVALMRPSGVTHAIDMDQRYVPLDFTQSGAQVTATAPSSAYRAVPGWYMLVVVDSSGVPSVASWVLLGNGQAVQDPGAPAPIAPAASVPATATISALSPTVVTAGATVDFASSWTGPPTSFAWSFGDGGTSGAAHPSHRFTVAGSYSVRLTVKNAKNPQGSTSNTVAVDVVAASGPPPPDGGGTTSPPAGGGATTPPTGGSTTTPETNGTPAAVTPAPVGADLPGPAGPLDGVGLRTRQTFTAIAHASVASRGSAAGAATLQVRQGRGAGAVNRRAFVGFEVAGLGGRAPARAVLRLYATDGSTDGGSVFAVSGRWPAAGLSWTTAPGIAGSSLAAAGAITRGRWVDLDVTAAVTHDGRVDFGLASTSDDGAGYAATGAQQPQLVITPAAAPGAAPVADFTAAPRSGTGPLAVAFADRSTGATSWAWDFQGDGTVDSTQRNPRFTYARPGTYAVRLTARNGAGADVADVKDLIVVTAAGTARVTRRFAPVADASVSSLAPRATAPAARTLGVRQGDRATPATTRAYLKFRVRGIGGVPASARLRLYVAGGATDGGSAFPVTNGWTERGLAWSTAPGLTLPSLASAGATVAGTWIELDVTRGVAGDGDVSFALSGTAAGAAAYASREDAAHRPQLVITAAAGSTARQAQLRRAHLASLLSPRPSLLCPLDHGDL